MDVIKKVLKTCFLSPSSRLPSEHLSIARGRRGELATTTKSFLGYSSLKIKDKAQKSHKVLCCFLLLAFSRSSGLFSDVRSPIHNNTGVCLFTKVNRRNFFTSPKDLPEDPVNHGGQGPAVIYYSKIAMTYKKK